MPCAACRCRRCWKFLTEYCVSLHRQLVDWIKMQKDSGSNTKLRCNNDTNTFDSATKIKSYQIYFFSCHKCLFSGEIQNSLDYSHLGHNLKVFSIQGVSKFSQRGFLLSWCARGYTFQLRPSPFINTTVCVGQTCNKVCSQYL